jgi:hypothetical protein
VVAWIFLHVSAILAFVILVIVLWPIFRNGRHLKARLERAKIDSPALFVPQPSMPEASLPKVSIKKPRTGDPKARNDRTNPQTRFQRSDTNSGEDLAS